MENPTINSSSCLEEKEICHLLPSEAVTKAVHPESEESSSSVVEESPQSTTEVPTLKSLAKAALLPNDAAKYKMDPKLNDDNSSSSVETTTEVLDTVSCPRKPEIDNVTLTTSYRPRSSSLNLEEMRSLQFTITQPKVKVQMIEFKVDQLDKNVCGLKVEEVYKRNTDLEKQCQVLKEEIQKLQDLANKYQADINKQTEIEKIKTARTKTELGELRHAIKERDSEIKRLSTALQEKEERVKQLEADLNKTELVNKQNHEKLDND